MKYKTNEKLVDALLSDESFQRWLSGNGSEEDNEKWSRWLGEGPQNEAMYRQALELWQAAQFKKYPLPNVHSELNKLFNRLNMQNDQCKPKCSKSRPTILTMNRQLFWKLGAAAISAAAVLLIVFHLNFSILNFSFGDEFTTVTTKYGQRITLHLEDGSKIILNSNSILKYPKNLTPETKRELYLHGEAYFEVTRKPAGPQHDFTVVTDEGLISVIGTSFTVSSRKHQTKVALLKGIVKVMARDKSDNFKISTSIIMKAGQCLRFTQKAKVLKPQNNISSLQASWWKDQLILNNTSLEEIVARLKETYGVEVELKDQQLLKKTITGSIENNSLDFIIKTLSSVLQVPVSVEGNKVIFEKSNI
ncbi:anti-FecI sigma factor, FecR [Caldithrix abyssi DSM 13497]|uniref:Anti-FecI sigma factor, FecR n=1 Tax=Caldithrix abyssi DSM 13497 TaxID=880073 RepID=H1XSN0_CALAY|nr:FecR domain-containing protein [Caldithrix abyssi]APF18590.1 ferric-dicitrate binding protein FerR, regulates iron transport through sigma-19 [Caldithrix abyssi DSM 13497]EHO42578.1 anti-FecI sigma factor, FecR [Caldithrix abyssi DSM 13497]